MGGKSAVLGLLESEGEGVKRLVRAKPDKAAMAQFHIRLVGGGIAGANAAVQAVAGNHQVGAIVRGAKP